MTASAIGGATTGFTDPSVTCGTFVAATTATAWPGLICSFFAMTAVSSMA
jgi:hypothetical protein